jgi:hypothetical protein
MKKLSLALLLLSSFANAHEINFGAIVRGEVDFEYPLLSFRHEGNLIKIRFKVESPEQVKCTEWRKDLCGKEEEVAMIELVTKAKNCQIEKDKLIDCRFTIFDFEPETSSTAIMHDGTKLTLRTTETQITVGTLTTLAGDMFSQQKKKQAREATYIGFEFWGHRADGLDPLVQWHSTPNLFTNTHLTSVSRSLFDEGKK